MAMNGCGCGLAMTALVALVLVPTQYFVGPDGEKPAPPGAPLAWLEPSLAQLAPFHLFATVGLVLLALLIYLCEWIQRKIMEKRIVKLNQYLSSSVARLRAWDAQQEQLEATLKLVQNATSEYDLLLYLILRQQRCVPEPCPPSDCFFDKGMEHVLS